MVEEEGKREKAAHEKTSQDWCDEFEREYNANSSGRVVWENPNTTLTHLRAYSFPLASPESADVDSLHREAIGATSWFGHLAAQAGYEVATAPILVQNAWQGADGSQHPRLFVLLQEMAMATPHAPPQELGRYDVQLRPAKQISDLLILQAGADKAVDWKEPTKALYHSLFPWPFFPVC
jgi:hypothetical protein